MRGRKLKLFYRLRLRTAKYHCRNKYNRRLAKIETKAEIEDWRQQAEERIIMLASDEKHFVNGASKLLEKAGYIVVSAMDGFGAWKMYEEQRYEISMLIVDDGIPSVSSDCLVELVREKSPNFPVILRTSDPEKYKPSKGIYFLDKSVGNNSLRALVEKAFKEVQNF